MKIVFLDAKTIGEDIDLSDYDKLGQVVKYDFSTPDEIPERVKDAQVLVINKAPMNEKTLRQAEKLKLICVTASKEGLPGGMWRITLLIPWHSIPLPCCFISWNI